MSLFVWKWFVSSGSQKNYTEIKLNGNTMMGSLVNVHFFKPTGIIQVKENSGSCKSCLAGSLINCKIEKGRCIE